MKSFITIKNILIIFVILMSVGTYAQTDSVYYHDYSFESQYGASGGFTTDYMRFVTRFTPPYYPAQLIGIRGWFRNGANPSTLRGVWYVDTTGATTGPGTIAAGLTDSIYNNPSTNGVTDSAYSLYSDLTSYNILVPAGEVYAGFTQHLQQNGFAGMAIDTSYIAVVNRQWIYFGSWETMLAYCATDGNWGITAYFIPVTTGISNAGGNDISFNVYPSPAKENVTISYKLIENTTVSIHLFNAIGKEIMNVINKDNGATGNHSIVINTSDISGGVYFCTITSGSYISTKELVIIK